MKGENNSLATCPEIGVHFLMPTPQTFQYVLHQLRLAGRQGNHRRNAKMRRRTSF